MFPFNLSGPPFLLFYLVLALLALGAYWYYATAGGNSPAVPLNELTSDPYKIALLRAGEDETARLAVVNLVDRGLLLSDGAMLQAGEKAHAGMLRRPLDRAILERCRQPATPDAVVGAAAVRAACAAYKDELVKKGLLPSDQKRSAVFAGLVAVLGLLGGLALARILISLSRGHSNVLFLVLLAAAACWIAYRIYARRTTPAGSRSLASLAALMQRLKARTATLDAGGATNEALLLASVFGIYELPGNAFPFIEQLFPKPRQPASGSNWADSSSSSSCGSSGGGDSGCGGGGGGCGGGGD